MSINVSEMACSPASVVAVLADGWLFAGWVKAAHLCETLTIGVSLPDVTGAATVSPDAAVLPEAAVLPDAAVLPREHAAHLERDHRGELVRHGGSGASLRS